MNAISKILVPLDHEHPSPAAPDRASRLAKHFGASVTLVSVVQELPWYARIAMSDAEGIERAILNEERRRLEELADPIRSSGITVDTQVTRGRPALEIVREAVRGGYDLLIKDAGRSAEGTFLSADRQILRTCPCPVWLLRLRESSERGPQERMLALVDPAPLGVSPATPEARESVSTRILDLATILAEAEHAELRVAHVWDATAQGLLRNCGYTEDQIHEYVENVQAGVTRALDKLMERYHGRIAPEAIRLIRGIPTTVIPEYVEEENVDLIIMGTMARSGITGMLIGNTAESILSRASCSILAVKPEGFVSPIEVNEDATPDSEASQTSQN